MPALSCLEQHALGAGHLTLATNDRCARHPQCHRQSLEGALSPVVVVVAVQAVDVHGDAGALRKAVQAVGNHLAAKITDLLAAQAQLADAVRAVGEVDDSTRQGFVQWAVSGSEAREAGCSVKGGLEGLDDCVLARGQASAAEYCGYEDSYLAKRNEGVFGSVVVVNVQITAGAQAHAPAAVLG
jgi:hypothetical protein